MKRILIESGYEPERVASMTAFDLWQALWREDEIRASILPAERITCGGVSGGRCQLAIILFNHVLSIYLTGTHEDYMDMLSRFGTRSIQVEAHMLTGDTLRFPRATMPPSFEEGVAPDETQMFLAFVAEPEGTEIAGVVVIQSPQTPPLEPPPRDP